MVLDDDSAAEPPAEFFSGYARNRVDRTAGRKWHNHPDRPFRIAVLGTKRANAGNAECGAANGCDNAAPGRHKMPSRDSAALRPPAASYIAKRFSPKAMVPADRPGCRRSAIRRGDPWQAKAGHRDRLRGRVARPAWPAPSPAMSPPCNPP